VRDKVDAIYRSESRRVLATLIRLLGDSIWRGRLARAFAAAVEQWGREGIPANPRTWLISTGRFRLSTARRNEKFESADSAILDAAGDGDAEQSEEGVEDDRLRLILPVATPPSVLRASRAHLRECAVSPPNKSRALSDTSADTGAKDRSGQGKDQGCADPL